MQSGSWAVRPNLMDNSHDYIGRYIGLKKEIHYLLMRHKNAQCNKNFLSSMTHLILYDTNAWSFETTDESTLSKVIIINEAI